ncbi:cyclase family protein [Paenibacillus sp. GCM10027626]|uniref:cyclase family protein n=1 Tax=Paenibacillus sp. GCM10027626 TaxID=3273411 RepID=UPI00362F3B94
MGLTSYGIITGAGAIRSSMLLNDSCEKIREDETVSRTIDITGTIANGMWNYGMPFPDIAIKPVATLAEHGFDGHAFQLHSFAGTYLETANHLFAGREQLHHIDPSRFFMRAWVAQVPDKAPLEPIYAHELEEAVGDVLEPGDALLIATGWDSRWNTAEFTTASPFFSDETMEWIVQRSVSLLGVDITSIEDPRKPPDVMSQLAHYFAGDRLLLAPVVRLREAGKGPWTLTVLPLAVHGVCAAPCRAILR